MKKKDVAPSANYLEKIPSAASGMPFSCGEDGRITLEVANTGFFNKMAQKLFHRPPVTYVHLDELGSFVWQHMDGKKDILALGQEVAERFGDKANPLYERLAKYFQILDSYHFITWME